jgi:Ribbon-helix-helix protein, copG family
MEAPMADTKDDGSQAQRVTVTLPGDALEFLQKEATRSRRSLAEVLRRSIATEKFFQEQRQSGAEVFLKPRGSRTNNKLVFKD